MSRRDALAVALAAAAGLGALHPAPVGVVLGAVAVVVAAWRRLVVLAVIGVALLTSGAAQRSLDGLDGLDEGAVRAEVVLLTDPAPSFGGVRAEVRLGGRRVEARADGPAAEALRDRLAGEVVMVRGALTAAAPSDERLRVRHLAGRLRVLRVEGWRAGGAVSRAANGLRRTLDRGAAHLPAEERSLLAGLVLGDDRSQPAPLTDDFRGAGLTHLLAVSGQNVAFLLAVAAPLLRLLRFWPRLAATLALVGFFALLTRAEPSVLRASAMAALAAALATAGARAPGIRVLAMAVTALLVIDPLLVHSVGFGLSVAASAAILLLAGPLAGVLPGPRPLREGLGVTLAAQLGVAPLLLATFGPVPVASIPANLLAVGAAGAVMVWGMTAGLVAGWLGGPVALVLHLPTRLALAWLRWVAHLAAGAGLGELHGGHLALLATGAAVAIARRARPGLRRAGLVLAAVAVLAAVVAAQAAPPLRSSLAPGVVRWHRGSTDVVVLGGAGGGSSLGEGPILAALRRAGVRTVALLVVAGGDVPAPTVRAVLDAHRVGSVVAAPSVEAGDLTGGTVRAPPGSTTLAVGDLVVRLITVGDRVVVEAEPG